MKTQPMPEIVSQNGFRIPGGWTAHVPEFFADSTYTAALSTALLSECGGLRNIADKEARSRVDELGTVEFVSRLRDFVKRNADIYAKRWPHLVNTDKTLKGFEPDELQRRFIPGSKSIGRFPKPHLISALSKMANAA